MSRDTNKSPVVTLYAEIKNPKLIAICLWVDLVGNNVEMFISLINLFDY